MVAILQNIRSLHNVGSIFRTADGAGFDKLYLVGITGTPHDRFKHKRIQVSKVALGAKDTVAWEYAQDIDTVLNQLRADGFTIYALEQAPGAVPYTDVGKLDLDKTALVVGHEVDGIEQETLDRCDGIIEIPMHGEKESLNVSVAFGIVAFHLIRT